MRTLTALAEQSVLNGKRVLIRADLNVPQDPDGKITDDTRIHASLPAVRMALDAGAAVMITSHLGRPTEGEYAPQWSLQPIAQRIAQLLSMPAPLLRDWTSGVAITPGQLIVLENCRLNKGEKSNDPVLARQTAALCDVYVNDAFATAHRAEATTEGVARYAPISCAGPLLKKELDAIGKALQSPARPLTAIVGGSKVSTKLTLLGSLSQHVDQLIVGGGIANTFLLAAGHNIGKSLAEPDLVAQAKTIIKHMHARGMQLPLPESVVVAKTLSEDATARTINIAEIEADDMILDFGRQSATRIAETLSTPGTIVWNGPLGVFETAQFAAGTATIAQAIASSPAYSLAGGGDTIAAIARFGITDQMDYISTGGGAFLEMLEGRDLPAVAALQRQ